MVIPSADFLSLADPFLSRDLASLVDEPFPTGMDGTSFDPKDEENGLFSAKFNSNFQIL